MGDIGLLGAKTRDGREAYHVFVGGGFGTKQACGRQLFQAMPFEELLPTVENMLRIYLNKRDGAESFQAFANRHDLNSLQLLFAETA
jgi:ferredoxin-nitrite reductase